MAKLFLKLIINRNYYFFMNLGFDYCHLTCLSHLFFALENFKSKVSIQKRIHLVILGRGRV